MFTGLQRSAEVIRALGENAPKYETTGPSTSTFSIYPCNNGMSNGPRGYHHFQANEHGAVCTRCGAKPKEAP